MNLDFSLAPSVAAALAIGLAQPVYLFALARIPLLFGRNALQFLLGALVGLLLWMLFVRPISILELMALGLPLLVYLAIWGLMSRGYTLGILLTLHGAGRPLTAAEIRAAYRGGDGLDWILRHRSRAMVAAGVLQGDRLTPRGALVARLHALSVAALGLRRTG